jgi:hypothetical protein
VTTGKRHLKDGVNLVTMTEEQWKTSFDKWNNVCHTLARWKEPMLDITDWADRPGMHGKRDPIVWTNKYVFGYCTYCDEFRRNYWDDHPEEYVGSNDAYIERLRYNCALCPLYRAGCCSDRTEGGPKFRFWLLVKAVEDRRWEHAHAHAAKILQAITDSKLEATGRSVDDYLRETNG